ncbi:MAG: exonuclease domain-containing protein [Clostridiales bacterium]|nr:exonuclease domain-containing protein [Clostridiales bacterium]
MMHIFIDTEMNPVSREFCKIRKVCKNEIIQIGAVMLDENSRIAEKLRVFVKPQWCSEIIPRITDLTGITSAMVANAEKFETVIEKFSAWCSKYGSDYIVHAWSEHDLSQVKKELKVKNIEITDNISNLLNNWSDFQTEFCQLIKSTKLLSLEKALTLTGHSFKGKIHDALWDAQNTSELFVLSQDKTNLTETISLIEDTVNNNKDMTFKLGDIFDFSSFEFSAA